MKRAFAITVALLALIGAPLTWVLVARHRAPVGYVRCPPPDQDWCCALWWPMSYDHGDHGGPLIYYDTHHGCGKRNADGEVQ